MSAPNFNFIVGIGRSGTTLLMSMLNAHPSIQATPEVNFFNFFSSQWKNKHTFSEEDYKLVEKFLHTFSDINFSGFNIDFEQFKNNESKSFKELYQNFYSSFLYSNQKKEASHFFDKNTINSLFLKEIISFFPEAKFIFMVRDPRANYLSRKQKQKIRTTNLYFNSYRWLLYNKEILEYASKYPNNILTLKYECLVSNPDIEMKRIADFFNFEYDECMLKFHESVLKNSFNKVSNEKLNNHSFVKYNDLSKPINTSRLDSWKKELSAQEIFEIDYITNEIAIKFGYEKSSYSDKTINKFKLIKAKIKAKVTIHYDKLVSLFPLKLKLKRNMPN